MPSERLVVSTSDKQVPIVTFTNGTLRKSSKRKVKVGAFCDSKHRAFGKRRKIMMVETHKMSYKGDNFGSLAAPSQSTQMYVAEVNRDTREMTLFPTEMFQLHPMTQADLQRDRLELESMSLREKSDILMDAFGSRKQKRALQQRQKRQLGDEAITSAMESAVDMALTSQLPQPQEVTQETSSAIPPYNKNAKTPADVYHLTHILGQTEMDSLVHASEPIKDSNSARQKEWADSKQYHVTVLSRMKALPMNETARQEKACLLQYLQYMITMYSLKYDQLRKKDPLPEEWPDAIKQLMLDRFTVRMDGQKRCVPARVKDLLLSHILVMCLILDGFTTHLSTLITDLKVSSKKLTMHARALGCRVAMQSSGTTPTGSSITSPIATLKVPLTFPEPPRQRKAKK